MKDSAAHLNPASRDGDIAAAVRTLGDAERAAGQQRFFKTGPGQYGEGDVFAGVRVPVLRSVSKRLRGLDASTVRTLLDHEIHEVRLLALLVLTLNADRAGDDERAAWVQLYRESARAGRVNNWDLVDVSADPILGVWLVAAGDHRELLDWAAADDLWQRRIGIVGTFAFIKAGLPQALLDVAPLVIADRRDLIQKAFGWMLREQGKRVDRSLLLDYLDSHAGDMGRTALSYAAEHLTPAERTHYRSL